MAAVNIDYVRIENVGNSSDPATGYGSVFYIYQISKNETTISQYAEFLNVKAQTDPYGLYNTGMATDANSAGITRSGDNPTPFPFAFSADDLGQSVCQFLMGRKLRVLKPGEVGTTEIDPGRITIQLADSGRIEAVHIDPDLPAV